MTQSCIALIKDFNKITRTHSKVRFHFKTKELAPSLLLLLGRTNLIFSSTVPTDPNF